MKSLLKLLLILSIPWSIPWLYDKYTTFDRRLKYLELQRTTIKVVNKTEEGVGTGVVIANSLGTYDILTAGHLVCSDNDKIEVYFEGQTVEAKVTRCDKDLDLALIQVTPVNYKIYPARICTKVDTFDIVFALGAGYGFPVFPTKGIVGNPNVKEENYKGTANLLQHSAPIVQGFSGGPLFKQELIGYCLAGINVYSRGIRGRDGSFGPIGGYSFAIGIATINKFLNKTN